MRLHAKLVEQQHKDILKREVGPNFRVALHVHVDTAAGGVRTGFGTE